MMHKGSRISRLLHLRSANSLTQIMKADTTVLNEMLSMPSSSFLMSLCRLFSSGAVAGSSLTQNSLFSLWNSLQNLRRKRKVPSMPCVSQGLDCSKGPRNISLVEGPSEKNPEMLSGYTEKNKLVHFKGGIDLVGQIVKVKILESHTYSMIGELINE